MDTSENMFVSFLKTRYVVIPVAVLAVVLWAVGEKVTAQTSLFPGTAPSAASPTPSPSETPTPTPTPIPLAGVVQESARVERRIDEMKRTVLGDTSVVDTRRRLGMQTKKLDDQEPSARRKLAGIPSLDTIDDIEKQWRGYLTTVDFWRTDLSSYSAKLDEAEQELSGIHRLWKELKDSVDGGKVTATPTPAASPSNKTKSGKSAAEPGPDPTDDGDGKAEAEATPEPGMTVKEVPGAIRLTIDQTISDIEKAQNGIAEARTELLDIQASVSKQEERIEQIADLAVTERNAALSNLITRESPPLWSVSSLSEISNDELAATLSAQYRIAIDYVVDSLGGIIVLLIISFFIYLALRRAKRSTLKLVEKDPELDKVLVFFNSPLASTALITIYLYGSASEKLPELLVVFLAQLILIPAYVILQKVVERPIVPVLTALVGFYLYDEALSLFYAYPFVYRIMFGIEMLAAVALVIWLYKRDPGKVAFLTGHERLVAFVKKVVLLSSVPLGISFLANLFGYVNLARFLAGGLLKSAYAGLFLYAFYLILVSFAVFLLRVRPLSRLKMVQFHRSVVRSKISKFLRWWLVLWWIISTLGRFYILDPINKGLSAAISFEVTLGSFSMSLADVLIFCVIVWLAFALSKFIRFVLEEDVYTRVQMSDGVPYAASTILHYVLLVAGFSLAILSLGIDLTKFTILAGAFGVGLAFGLQNIVENFISGVILLFERPVKVGDVIQKGDQIGDLKRIGLRASVLGTFEGAEVIVPNGHLLSQEVTNLTPANDIRRLDVNVGVSYDSDPEEVMRLLAEVGESHPEVVSDPPPQVLFIGFGDSALDFQLRTWADNTSKWPRIRSDITLGVFKALSGAGIEIPFPQRDLRIKDSAGVAPVAKDGRSGNGDKKGEE